MKRLAVALIVALSVALGACDQHTSTAILVCHNANCAHATDPFKDSMMASLDDSLALEYLGRPAIDGMEIDLAWDPATRRCLFAHDLAHSDGGTILDAADHVAAYLRESGDFVSWTGNSYFVKLETKGALYEGGPAYADADLPEIYACLFDAYGRLRDAALDSGRELEVAFEAPADFVRKIAAQPGWPGKEPEPHIHVRLISAATSPGLHPSDIATPDEGRPENAIDILSFHYNRAPDGEINDFLVLDVPRMLWNLDTTIETFYAIETYDPAYIVSNEAVLMRRWMEN